MRRVCYRRILHREYESYVALMTWGWLGARPEGAPLGVLALGGPSCSECLLGDSRVRSMPGGRASLEENRLWGFVFDAALLGDGPDDGPRVEDVDKEGWNVGVIHLEHLKLGPRRLADWADGAVLE